MNMYPLAAAGRGSISPDNNMGAAEYYERREHDKLHEKLDFLMQ